MKNAINQTMQALFAATLLCIVTTVSHAKDPQPNQPTAPGVRRLTPTAWSKKDTANPQYIADENCVNGAFGPIPYAYQSRRVEGGITPWYRCTSSIEEECCGASLVQPVCAYEHLYKSRDCPRLNEGTDLHTKAEWKHISAENKGKDACKDDNVIPPSPSAE